MSPARLTVRGENSGHNYPARTMTKPISFHCVAPEARAVSLVGDFNRWDPVANPMERRPDGSWSVQIPLYHGHHRYLFLVDGQPTLDPRATGTTRDEHNQRVSLCAVS